MTATVREQIGGKVAGLTMLGLVVLLGGGYAGVYAYAGDRTPRNAAVEGIDIGGLAPEAAQSRLEEALPERLDDPIVLSLGDGRTRDIDPEDAGLSVDVEESVAAAGGGASFAPARIWAVITGGGETDAVVEVDQQRMTATLDALDKELGERPVEGGIRFRDGKAVTVTPRAGVVVRRSATAELLREQFLGSGSRKVPTEVSEPFVDAAEVQRALREFAEPAVSGPVTLVLGGQKVVAPPTVFGQGLSMEAVDGRLEPRVDGERMLAALEPVMRTVGVAPQDARFVIRNGTPRVVPAKVGIEIDPDELEERFADVAVRTGAQRRLELDGRRSQPELTTAEAKALGIKEEVGTFTTNFPYAEYRNVNLTRAAELVDGTVLEPGETFSLNETVGERTRANGFVEGYIVSDGIFKKDLGGGVSQIATTTFNAMFFAGLEDIEHKPHSVYIDRYPVGREATVAWPSVDLRFRNDSPYGVLIKASVRKSTPSTQGAATVTMYSTERFRITTSEGARENIREPKTRYLPDDEDCEEFEGTDGFDITVFRYFRGLTSDKVLKTERFRTTYIPGDTVRCGPPPQNQQD